MKQLLFWPALFVTILSLAGCERDKPTPTAQIKPHLVEVVTAELKDISVSRERNGSLKAIQEIQIFNQEEGQIAALPFFEGDRVEKGQVIARLDDGLLRSQLTRAQALTRKSATDLAQIKDLVARKLTTQNELTRIETELAVAKAEEEALQTRLSYFVIRSPITGVVTLRNSEPGNIAERYSHLMTIADQQTLITEVQLSELLLNNLQEGDEASIQIDALRAGTNSNQDLTGKISRIYPDIDPMTRTGTLEIALNPVPAGARAGQFVRVTLTSQQAKRLLIPFIALRRSVEEEYVFTVNSDNQVQVTPVTTGLEIGDQIEILEGLAGGELVVIRGFTNLRDNKTVKIVNAPAAMEQAPSSVTENTP
ncbi:efflux RND transporter periplasmic adaptor subunit [Methylophaga sp.]|uniref:efflux RND transporter periplasmic adaptor subunit n=1 Tax=Methylophaga sp. TaxID=2024840 RepID=UPI003A9274C5